MALFDIFSKKNTETKASAVASIINIVGGNQAKWTDRKYTAQSTAGYVRNVIAYKSINEIARAVASTPIKLFNGERELSGHPFLDLMARPNSTQSKSAFLQALVSTFKLSGDVFIEVVKLNGEPIELFVHRPDRIKIETNSQGVSAYIFEINGRSRRFPVDPITQASDLLHIKSFNPLDELRGLSTTEAAAWSIDTHNSILEWNKKLLDNDARPSGALVQKDANVSLSQGDLNQLKRSLEDNFSGPSKSGKPMVLGGGLEWVPLSINPKDMDHLNNKHSTARDISLAYGVPPLLLNIPGDSTYNNYREARLAFYEDTIIPLLNHIADEINYWLLPQFGDNLTMTWDLDDLPAMQLKREMKYQMLNEATFMTINEKREAVGLEPIAGGDGLVLEDVTDVEDIVDVEEEQEADNG